MEQQPQPQESQQPQEPQHIGRNYPVWSNFIYFIASIYALAIAVQKARNNRLIFILFGIYGILILFTGVISIIYHTHTPSYTGQRCLTDKFGQWLAVDQGFALTILLYSILMFVVAIIKLPRSNRLSFLLDSNLYLSGLFIILSLVFYILADKSNKAAIKCENKQCFRRNIDAYDIFHSNWHIFTSVGLLFWTSLVSNLT